MITKDQICEPICLLVSTKVVLLKVYWLAQTRSDQTFKQMIFNEGIILFIIGYVNKVFVHCHIPLNMFV